MKSLRPTTLCQCPQGVGITAIEAVKIEGAVFIDYRTTKAIGVSALPEAVAIAKFLAHKDQFRNRPIVIYDYAGTMSCSLAQSLRDDGFNAYALAGGVLGWSWAGGKFLKNGEVVQRVHV